MVDRICEFNGEYGFLSNFYPCQITCKDGLTYPSAECAFQAHKLKDVKDRIRFTKMTSVEARYAGRSVPLREDWNEIRELVMYSILMRKFMQNADICKKLVKTYPARQLLE